MTRTRINPRHAWLIERGWLRVADRVIGGRIQARWTHERNGDHTYNTDLAEYSQLQHERKAR